MDNNINFSKGLPPLLACYLIWGLQPLYWAAFGTTDNMFLMASRIIWASVFCLLLVKLQGKMPQLIDVFKNRKTFLTEAAAMLFLAADWIIYLLAVRTGHVMESCMGYYIQPIIVFAFGALVFHEHITWKHIAILAVIFAGVCFSAQGFGSVPYITISLALCFAVYSAIKKGLNVDSIVSTTSEIIMMAPFALLYILIFRRGGNGLAGVTLPIQLLLIGSGIVTAAPMLFFALGVHHLPLTAIGIMQFFSPTISLLCSLFFMGETMNRQKLTGFVLTWIAIAAYLYITLPRRNKHSS